MKRFEITASDGRKFQLETDISPPLHPDWGINPTIVETDITQEIADKVARALAKQKIVTDLKTAYVNFSTLTPLEKDNVLKKILEHLGFDE